MSTTAVKLNHFGTYRRFTIPQGDDEIAFAALKQKIHTIDPSVRISWIDEDGDAIVIENVDEFRTALDARPEAVLRLTALKKADEKPKHVHRNITCDGCDGVIIGRRFKCLVCPDFDICEACEQAGKHPEHAMTRIVDDKTQLVPWVRPFGPFRCPRSNFFTPPPPPTASSTPGGPLRDEQLFKNWEKARHRMQKEEFKQTRADMKENRRERKRLERELREAELARMRESLRSSVNSGMDFLKEVGAQVQQALSNFGIDVDYTVENNGKSEKLERAAEAASEAKEDPKPQETPKAPEEPKVESPKEETTTAPLTAVPQNAVPPTPKETPVLPSAPIQARHKSLSTSSSSDEDEWLAVQPPQQMSELYPLLEAIRTQPTTSAVLVPPPHPHEAVINEITAMGFSNRQEVTRVVEMVKGNIDEAVNVLLSM